MAKLNAPISVSVTDENTALTTAPSVVATARRPRAYQSLSRRARANRCRKRQHAHRAVRLDNLMPTASAGFPITMQAFPAYRCRCRFARPSCCGSPGENQRPTQSSRTSHVSAPRLSRDVSMAALFADRCRAVAQSRARGVPGSRARGSARRWRAVTRRGPRSPAQLPQASRARRASRRATCSSRAASRARPACCRSRRSRRAPARGALDRAPFSARALGRRVLLGQPVRLATGRLLTQPRY